jgi:nucleoside 2-deoxyribosyltransferase
VKNTLYWAGPRCFLATMRHFDLETIRILEEDYGWIIYYPLKVVLEASQKSPSSPMFGKNGIIRTACFEYVEKSDIIVAYTGLIWDTGTAREVEYAVSKDKPVLAWSDSSVVFGETIGRNAVINGSDFDKLYVRTMPFNAMDVVFDRYLEISELYNDGLKEQELAKEIDKEATLTIKNKNR